MVCVDYVADLLLDVVYRFVGMMGCFLLLFALSSVALLV